VRCHSAASELSVKYSRTGASLKRVVAMRQWDIEDCNVPGAWPQHGLALCQFIGAVDGAYSCAIQQTIDVSFLNIVISN